MRSPCTDFSRGRGGGDPDQEVEGGAPPEQRVLLAHGMQERERGEPPEQERTPFVRVLIQEMGEGALELQRPPTAIQIGVEGERGEQQTGRGCREGAPPPLGRRGTTEE